MTNNILKKQSIFFTITITFLISIILVIISFSVLYKSSEKRENHFQGKINQDITRIVLQESRHNGITKELKENLSEMNFILIDDKNKQKSIVQNKNIKTTNGFHRREILVRYLKLNNKSFIYINTPRDTILIENNNKSHNHKYTLFAIFIIILSIFILLYFITINKLKPIKTLQQQMKDFANEKFDIDCATNKQDEISQLANEFHKTAKKLKTIKESRDVFIRNIMHELKTPITKGKFLTQLPQTEQNIETMQKVFYRLESLINEFTNIEELLSTSKELDKKEYSLVDIIDNASDILMCDEDKIIKDFNNIKLNVDFKLFSIAIKNLLDNGIKYSTNKQVKIKTQNNNILFENVGDELSYNIEDYYEPFFKGDNVKSNQSFGLGLYIVKHILEANDYKIVYKYENGVNIFKLINKF